MTRYSCPRSKLSLAWTKHFIQSPATANTKQITAALERTIPLLQDPTAVPFVCRYRTDVISPLTTKQIHQLSEFVQKYATLESLRKKILPYLVQQASSQQDNNNKNTTSSSNNAELIFRVETSLSKSELEDIYTPFKPPSKGSLEDRIKKSHPHLVTDIDDLWYGRYTTTNNGRNFQPRDDAVTLLANRIAGDVDVVDGLYEFCAERCRVMVKRSSSSCSKKSSSSSKKKCNNDDNDDDDMTYASYFDFNCKLSNLKDYQVLAIRRGIDRKKLTLSYDIDNAHVTSLISRKLLSSHRHRHELYPDAIKNAWTRLLRKRITTRLWKRVSQSAQRRAMDVFCMNLRKALLAPPPERSTETAVLALDPGFKAGIKCAILDPSGEVISLQTVHFMGDSSNDCCEGRTKMEDLLRQTAALTTPPPTKSTPLPIALGNGHGTHPARRLVTLASQSANIPIVINLVNEAGASVWSVSPSARRSFPRSPPAAIASVSIGRRYQNPLAELVKIPPRSLGLGMYQHDLDEKELDAKLVAASVDAVAEVGVDVNVCSKEILERVPSLTAVLCERIVDARPIRSRRELLDVEGIGEKIFENCAAFVRIKRRDGVVCRRRRRSEEEEIWLDDTLVHPESYDLARYLLKKMKWAWGEKTTEEDKKKVVIIDAPSTREGRRKDWDDIIRKAAKRFGGGCSEERIFAVMEQLFRSLTNPDPRLGPQQRLLCDDNGGGGGIAAMIENCKVLPSHISTTEALLLDDLPLRNIKATVRNIVDFGAFVDFGGENDGLLHRSKMGSVVPLDSLFVGQEIGIDILGVSLKGKKVSVGLAGLNLPKQEDRDLIKKKVLGSIGKRKVGSGSVTSSKRRRRH